MNDFTFYVWTPGGRLLWKIDATGTGFYHFDRIGSTIEITNGAGNQIALFGYTPYGEMLPGSSGSDLFTYVGQYGVRAEEDLFEMGARYYDPASARFLTRDPLPPRLDDVKSLNPYAYANQNPRRYVDPFGAKSFVISHVLETSGRITNTKIFGGSAHSSAGGMVRTALATSRKPGFKIADNESPRPQDRVCFNYNYFDNIVPAGPGLPVNRELIGFEKTFLDEPSFVGPRLPFPIVNAPTRNPGYHYLLEVGTGGKLLGGTFCTDSVEDHPDFLWAPIR